MKDFTVGQEAYYVQVTLPTSIVKEKDLSKYITKVQIIEISNTSIYVRKGEKIVRSFRIVVKDKITKGNWVVNDSNKHRLWRTEVDAYTYFRNELLDYVNDYSDIIIDLRIQAGNIKGLITIAQNTIKEINIP